MREAHNFKHGIMDCYKGMVSHLLRHQDPRMIDHYAEYQTEPLKSALDKVQRISKKRLKTNEVN